MDSIIKNIEKINNVVGPLIWGPMTLILLILIGIYFSIRIKFYQIFGIKQWLFGTIKGFFKQQDKKGISSLQALSTAIGGAIGTGNIVGVATAITLGGSGAVLWMWIGAFFGMMTIFAENVLGVLYREKNKKGEFVGGPMYYIEKGVGSKFLAVVFSIGCIFSTFSMGNLTQSNSLALSIEETFKVEPKITACFLAIVVGVIIFGGVKRIVSFSEKIVPFMSLFYIIGGLVVIFSNFSNLSNVFNDIFKSAFNFRAVGGGITGYACFSAIRYGLSRGTFSNEAGLGSSPIVYSSASESNLVTQGCWGIFQVFFDTIIGCTIIAFCILSTGVVSTGKEGVVLSTAAFESVFGIFGSYFLSVSIIMFCFSTLIGWSYLGERAFEYLAGEKFVIIYKAIYIIMVLFGCVMEINLVWDLADTFNGIMMIPNLIALLLLSNQVVNMSKNI